ncbi:MAG TPA: translation initiation factor IF-2 [Candidatus Altiarchaeales archaeon]|nr:translation initiation factor IF-2 [Candidatus Altiarchaeales archaeon]
MELQTREPIISVLGHVDHGKTTILDYIRHTVVAKGEAGGITQHIGATDIPFDVILEVCRGLLNRKKMKLPLRGLLFIDTPGHESFTTLRKRGGSVADIAILVVDLNEGLMPQTKESLEILKQSKTPFVIAANKLDMIHGWMADTPLNSQNQHVKDEYYKRVYKLIGDLAGMGYNANIYSDINDFSKQIALVPVSAITGDGIPELLMMLIGLTQQYLAGRLSVGMETPAKGTILEVKETKGLGTTVDAIIYDGIIRVNDQIVVGARPPIKTKVKALLRPQPLDEMRDPKKKFKNVDEVYAASGVKIVAPGLEDAMAGAPIYVGGEELVEKVEGELSEVEFETDALGVVIKADTLGSLEAMINILGKEKIPIRKASIGRVSKTDVIEASAVRDKDKYLGVILAFSTSVLGEAEGLADDKNLRIFSSKVIYKILEDYEAWVKSERDADKKGIQGSVVYPAKFELMKGYVFRQSKPAVVGVKVLGGVLQKNSPIMREDGKTVGKVKEIQEESEKIDEAKEGMEVAVSIDNVTIGRQLSEGDTVYTAVTLSDIESLKKIDLTDSEKQVLKEIVEIRKK